MNAALTAASDACLSLVCRRIGSDEEQQLLKSAKDDLNIASSKHQGMHLPTLRLMVANLQKSDNTAPVDNFKKLMHLSSELGQSNRILLSTAGYLRQRCCFGCAAGDEGADSESAIEMLDNLQQHPQQNPREGADTLSPHRIYVYPLVLIAACAVVFVWRKSTLSRLWRNRRRFSPSRHEV